MTINTQVVARPDSTYPIVIRPYKLDISQFGDKVRDKMRFSITNVSDEDISLELIAGLTDIADVELPKKIKAGKSAEGVLKLKKDALGTSFEKSFTFQVDDELSSRFTVPVKRMLKKPSERASAKTKPATGK